MDRHQNPHDWRRNGPDEEADCGATDPLPQPCNTTWKRHDRPAPDDCPADWDWFLDDELPSEPEPDDFYTL